MVSRLGDRGATLQSIVDEPKSLLAIAHAGGAVVVFNEQCWRVGATPAEAQVVAIAE